MHKLIKTNSYIEFMQIKMKNQDCDTIQFGFSDMILMSDIFYDAIPKLDETKDMDGKTICNVAAEVMTTMTKIADSTLYCTSTTLGMEFIIDRSFIYYYINPSIKREPAKMDGLVSMVGYLDQLDQRNDSDLEIKHLIFDKEKK